MSKELESHEDLKRLIDQEYSLSIINAHLVVNDVYHLDSEGKLQKGWLAAPLNLVTPDKLGAPFNHQMYWSGSVPYYADGTPIPQLGNAPANLTLGGITFTRHLSNKPPEGFSTYTLLVEHYVALISAPAAQKFNVTARTACVYEVPAEDSPFTVQDTLSARAQIPI